jgi:hypothetical protein
MGLPHLQEEVKESYSEGGEKLCQDFMLLILVLRKES